MLIIVGLGNPGEKYKFTYHNLGFLAVTHLAESLNVKFNKKECQALTASLHYNNEHIVLAKPTTFVNCSGTSIVELLTKYKANISDTIVLCDDLDLPKATTRVRYSSGSGGHNGLKSIIDECGRDFIRIRMGIERDRDNTREFVLSNINKDDYPLYVEMFDKISYSLKQFFVKKDMDLLMRDLNSRS
ncbi:MAG: aminoacyl-tRNA hydrolase [Christensenellaceae bacterium]|jgi:PTH1 family peptidyl-tRNA hydrolase|nr:aminoacyl-tRNA hydrolase [Christensenellaceae bacterium]